MNAAFQPRDLTLDTRGADVRDLQSALRRLGYDVAVAERQTETFGPYTRDAVRAFKTANGLRPTDVVDQDTISLIACKATDVVPPTSFHVSGCVRRGDRTPLVEARVQVLDVDLRRELLLGEAATDVHGRYSITFDRSAFANEETEGPDVVVRAIRSAGAGVESPLGNLTAVREEAPARPDILAASPVHFDAPPELHVDLVVDDGTYRAPSEFERIRDAVTPLLDGLVLAELTEQDREFLAGETNYDAEWISFFARAMQLGNASPAAGVTAPADAFYALFREGLPTDGEQITAAGESRLRGALEAAIADAIIPEHNGEWVQEVLTRLRELAIDHLLDAAGTNIAGGLVRLTIADAMVQRDFARAYLGRTGSMRDLWKTLRADERFAPVVPALQRAFQFGALTRQHLSLAEALESRFREGQHASIAQMLTPMTDGDWRALVERAGLPAGVPPDSRDAYIALLTRTVEAAFPTHYLAARLGNVNIEPHEPIVHFLTEHADRFNIHTDVLDKYLADNPSALDGAPEGTADALGALQRVYKVAPRAEHVAAVLTLTDARSAHDIVRMGRETFVAAVSATLDGTHAAAIHDNAMRVRDTAMFVHGKYAEPLNQPVGGAVAPPVPANQQNQIPNYSSLFGSLDFCACERCRSVCGPAAYLVDLLALLDASPVGPKKAKDYLFTLDGSRTKYRRGDIGEIELNCQNTNTPLPYIDLVNEVLEYVAIDSQTPPTLQTTRTADELAVSPEHVLAAAYDQKLAKAAYPADLPFDLGIEQARTFLGHLGVNRAELMETLQNRAMQSPDDRAIAAELLGLSPTEWQIVAGTDARGTWEYFGLSQNNNPIIDPLSDPANPKHITPGWLGVLGYAEYFLERTGTSQTEFLALMSSHFVQTLGGIAYDWPQTDCGLDRATISGLDDPKARSLHRFLRLRRKLGWSIHELDQFLRALNAGAMTEALLRRLAWFERIRATLNLPLAELLAWWGDVDTAIPAPGQPSFYDRVFPRTANAADDFLALDASRTELLAVDTLTNGTRNHVAEVAAGVGLAAAEVALLIGSDPGQVPDVLDLANLSRIYRIASLCRAVGMRAADYLSLRTLSPIDPFDLTMIAAWRFLDTLQTIRASGFSMAELDYVLRHRFVLSSQIAPAAEEIAVVLTEMRDALNRVAEEVGYLPLGPAPFPPADPTREIIRRSLAAAVPAPMVDRVFALLDMPASFANQADAQAFIADNNALIVALFDTLEPDPAKRAAAQSDAQRNLVDDPAQGQHPAPTLTSPADRYAYALGAVLAGLAKTRGESLVSRKLGAALGLDTKSTLALLRLAPPAATRLMDQFLDPAVITATDPVVDAPPFAAQFDAYRLLQKAAIVVSRFRITSDELPAYITLAPNVEWLELATLPLEAAAANASARFEAWRRTAVLFALRDRLPRVRPSVLDLIGLATSNAGVVPIIQRLVKLTGWDANDAEVVLHEIGLTKAADFTDASNLTRVVDAFAVLRHLAMPVTKVFNWIKPRLLVADAAEVKNAVKARYDRTQWRSVAKPLQDVLREKQRSALVSYITGRDGLTVEQLFDRYLIDVEMSACQLTSRIKQAIGSVQLFIQRVTMNLEQWHNQGIPASIAFSDEQAQWWREWMNSFVLWEFDRTMFLYPQDSIMPALRIGKTPLFEQLEKRLTHGDITPDLVDTAYREYLDGLDELAVLDVRGFAWQRANGGPDVMHVVGRTRATPHVYYYRRFVDARSWTPWQKVDVDITGEHLLPVVHDGRLRLYWPVFTTQTDNPSPALSKPDDDQTTTPPAKHLEIQLAWSEFKGGKWTAKRVTKESINSKDWNGDPTPSVLFFDAMLGADLAYRLAKQTSLYTGAADDLCIVGRRYHGPGTNVTCDGWFALAGCGGAPIPTNVPSNTVLPLTPPTLGSRMSDMDFVEDEAEQTHKNQLFIVAPALNGYPSLLGRTPGAFRLTCEHDGSESTPHRLFYKDDRRSFLVLDADSDVAPDIWADPDNADPIQTLVDIAYAGGDDPFASNAGTRAFRFLSSYHPYACDFISSFNAGGVDGLFTGAPPVDELAGTPDPDSPFIDTYWPNLQIVTSPFPRDEVDFSADGAYADYNWELFFHAPLFIAERLSQNQQFDEARRWFHFIFDPTDPNAGADPQRVWKFKPFKNRHELLLRELMALLDYRDADPLLQRARQLMIDNVKEWRDNPFDPDVVARHRLGAYMQAVVMKYIENTIAQADQLYRRNTIESINKATQLYVLGLELLGPRPREFPDRGNVPEKTYNELKPALDAFGNALVKLEHWVPKPQKGAPPKVPLPPGMSFYFCLPPDRKLLGYWDTIADRLFKIRHCLDIGGMAQQLPLFESPLDSVLAARARSLGVDLSSALSDSHTALPCYRFPVLMQKAVELCGDVRSLGAALLAALEKRDAESLAALRSTHELAVLNAVRDVRQRGVDDAQASVDALEASQAVIQTRLDFYSSRTFLNEGEGTGLALTAASAVFQEIATFHESLAAAACWVPQFTLGAEGWAGTPTSEFTFGGVQIAGSLQSAAANFRGIAGQLGIAASMSATIGSFQRRQDDWTLQKDVAAAELQQAARQLVGAQIRLDVAQKELANHELQIANAAEADGALRGKFTNAELYDWMVAQLSTVHFQSYQLAYDLARRAERAFQYERGDDRASFIQFGYWDSLKTGLLAGERLHYDLRRMEAAYLELNKRELEITKHVSLAALAPEALLKLKSTGLCTVELDEWVYASHHPGTYMLRIKSMGVTLPCTTGPYTEVNARLTMLSNKVRRTAETKGGYAETPPGQDARFWYDLTPQTIVTSTGVNDSGVFELRLSGDERFLPFEGAGAICRLQLELKQEHNDIDVQTLSDVVLHLRYTARDGGPDLEAAATASRPPVSGVRVFSAKHEFPTEWYRFLHPAAGDKNQTLAIDLSRQRFPFAARGKKSLVVGDADVYVIFKRLPLREGDDPPSEIYGAQQGLGLDFGPPLKLAGAQPVTVQVDPATPLLPHSSFQKLNAKNQDTWALRTAELDPATIDQRLLVDGQNGQPFHLNPDAVEDIAIAVSFSAS